MQLGLVLLIATPVARVAFTLVAFVLQRDRTYVVDHVRSVLALLLYGLLFGRGMKRHHAVVRITHWVNVDRAHDHGRERAAHLQRVSRVRATRRDVLLLSVRAPDRFPATLTFGGWLAGARNWHFAMMWVLVVNGLVYLGFIYLHGEWRDLVPRRGDRARRAGEMVRFYLTVRKDHPRQGKHNALQRLAYFSMPIVGIMAVVTGIAIWKPVQLSPLTDAARRIRLGALLALSGRCCCSSS